MCCDKQGITDINIELNLGESNVVADLAFCWYGMHIDNVKIITNDQGKVFLSYPTRRKKVGRVASCRPSGEIAFTINEAVFAELEAKKEALANKLNIGRKGQAQ